MNIILAIVAASVLAAPKGEIYNDSAIVTNVSFEGLAIEKDVIPREYWSAHDNMGWHCYWGADGLVVGRTGETFGKRNDLTITPDKILLNEEDRYGHRSILLTMGSILLGEGTKTATFYTDGITLPEGVLKFPQKSGTFAVLSDIEEVKSTISETVTNVVRNIQGLVYDEKLGITWKQTMYDGNLYYIAVTNANITEVK